MQTRSKEEIVTSFNTNIRAFVRDLKDNSHSKEVKDAAVTILRKLKLAEVGPDEYVVKTACPFIIDLTYIIEKKDFDKFVNTELNKLFRKVPDSDTRPLLETMQSAVARATDKQRELIFEGIKKIHFDCLEYYVLTSK